MDIQTCKNTEPKTPVNADVFGQVLIDIALSYE